MGLDAFNERDNGDIFVPDETGDNVTALYLCITVDDVNGTEVKI
jgi:hypothetical protein